MLNFEPFGPASEVQDSQTFGVKIRGLLTTNPNMYEGLRALLRRAARRWYACKEPTTYHGNRIDGN